MRVTGPIEYLAVRVERVFDGEESSARIRRLWRHRWNLLVNNGTTNTTREQHQVFESSRFSTQAQVPDVQRADQALALTEQRVQTEQSCLCVQPSSDGRTERAQQQHTVCTAVVLRSFCSISSSPLSQGFSRLQASRDSTPFVDCARGKYWPHAEKLT